MTNTNELIEVPTKKHPMENNVKKYFIAMFFRNLWISMPVGIIYFQDRGLSFFEMGVLEAIVSGIIFLTDIPSGAFADIFGRKLSTGLGLLLWGLSLILTGAFSTFNGYVITVILMGLGDSFISGAINALFYDSLKQMNKEQDYLKYTGKREVITAVSIIIATILGAFLYGINITLPFYAHGIALIIASAIVFTMKEPIPSKNSKTVAAQYNLIVKSLGFVWKNKIVRFITILLVE
ncbi:MAG: MFS transporter [Promethearchaeota archaeon]